MDSLGKKIIPLIGKYRYVLLVLLIGVILMMIPTKEKSNTAQVPSAEQTQPQEDIVSRLESILSMIKGAGKVKVMLTVAAGEKTVYQTDTDKTAGDSGSERIDTVVITDGNRNQSGLVQQINPATYLGAIVVCEGAASAEVRLAITEAVSNVTGLGANQISVLKMK